MGNGANRFSAGAAEMQRAAQTLRQVFPAMKEHTLQTRNLTERAKRASLLPYEERVNRFRELLHEYAAYIRKIGNDHDTVIPRFREEVEAGLRRIEEALATNRLLSSAEFTQLRDSLQTLQTVLHEARSNVQYFRGTLMNMPDLGQADVLQVRNQVTASLNRAIDVFDVLSKHVRDIGREVFQSDIEEE